jgi:hypothetical protein
VAEDSSSDRGHHDVAPATSNEPAGSFRGQARSPAPSLRDRTGAAGPYEIHRASPTSNEPAGSFRGQARSPAPSLRDRTGAAGPYEIHRASPTSNEPAGSFRGQAGSPAPSLRDRTGAAGPYEIHRASPTSNEPAGSFRGQAGSPAPSLRDRTGAAGPYEIHRASPTEVTEHQLRDPILRSGNHVRVISAPLRFFAHDPRLPRIERKPEAVAIPRSFSHSKLLGMEGVATRRRSRRGGMARTLTSGRRDRTYRTNRTYRTGENREGSALLRSFFDLLALAPHAAFALAFTSAFCLLPFLLASGFWLLAFVKAAASATPRHRSHPINSESSGSHSERVDCCRD